MTDQLEISNVSVKKSDTDYELLSVKEYFKIPIDKRMALVRGGKVEFIDFDGNKIALRDGLKMLSNFVKELRSSGQFKSYFE